MADWRGQGRVWVDRVHRRADSRAAWEGKPGGLVTVGRGEEEEEEVTCWSGIFLG